MTEEINPNFIRGGKSFKTQIIKEKPKPKTIHKNISTKELKKTSVIKSDMPDILNENNSNVFKEEKLLNFRKEHKHMTQLPKQIDKPDTLLGLNEFGKFPIKRFHSIKKLNYYPIPDLPDNLEPIKVPVA